MKKDGIQTRNRKLAAKAKKKRMHDFFKPLDPRFSAYATAGMHPASAAASAGYLTNPMSQYYAGQMGQMSQFMSATTPSMTSPMSHLTGLAASAASLDPLSGDPGQQQQQQHQDQSQQQQQQSLQQHQQQQQHHYGAPPNGEAPLTSEASSNNNSSIPTSLVGPSS